MKKNIFSQITLETLFNLYATAKKVETESIAEQRKQIENDSPYSAKINNAIRTYNEFFYYYSLQLQETTVTRPSLIRSIDFDLYISHEKKTNKQLMEIGQAPYASDDKETIIELHHIGQQYDSPFAELTKIEHIKDGNIKTLHPSEKESWRKDKKQLHQFMTEKSTYWKQRLNIQYKKPSSKQALKEKIFSIKEQTADIIKSAIESMFSECSIDDLQFIRDLSSSYILMKEIGASSLEDFVAKLREEEPHNNLVCTYCDSSEYNSYGFYESGKDRIRRYKCKKCGRTFTTINNSIIAGSNMSYLDWLKFIDCLYNGYSIKKTAKTCNISEKAAHDNRIKLFYALKLLDDKIRLQGNIVMDETYIPLSNKGNRSKQLTFEKPRQPHKRGHENHTPGISKNLVSILCALDSNGNSIARIASLGSPTAKKIETAIADAFDIENINCLYADKEPAILAYAKRKNLPLKRGKLIKKNGKQIKNTQINAELLEINQYLQRINAYHSRLRRFLNHFVNVSTNLLPGYLYLFAWKERNKHLPATEVYKELFSIMTKPNLYESPEDILSFHLPNINKIESDIHKNTFRNEERAREIYARYAAGETMQKIAKDYHMTHQAISRIIIKCRKLGIAYKTEKEKRRELLEQPTEFTKRQLRSIESFKTKYLRLKELHEQKSNWEGSLDDFYKTMMQKYGLKKQTIKNYLSEAKRVFALESPLYISDEYHYKKIQDVYQEIIDKYYKLFYYEEHSLEETISILSDEFTYKPATIRRILFDSTYNDQELRKDVKRNRMSFKETTTRDKELFVEYLRWTKTKKEFYKYATEKYNLSIHTIDTILYMHFVADQHRYEITND